MNILGISCYYHDSAAAILEDDKVIAAVEEERFSRIKFDDDFPNKSIEYCLEKSGISSNQLDCVAFYDKSLLKFDRLFDNYIAVAPRGFRSFLDIIPRWIHKRLWVKEEIKKQLDGFKGKIIFPSHHMSHAAYTFYTSPFEESAIITVDGVGEWTTTAFGYGKNNSIKLTHDVRWPHSLGLFYSAFTYYLGFKVNEGEYKVMGMAAYGKPKFYDKILEKLIDVKEDGSFQLNMKYFSFTYDKVMVKKNFADLFGVPVRKADSEVEQIHYDIAASAQLVLEDILMKIVKNVHEKTKQKNLCLGGGVALNGMANYKILKNGPFENLHIPPSPGDGGSAIGCALYAYHSFFDVKRKSTTLISKNISNLSYLGPSYSDSTIKSFLDSQKINYETLEKENLLKQTANFVANQKVVGWFQGSMEWGPRALGNRSILADPRNEKMKDIVNEKIKHREKFRPFAPSILEEHVSEYFDIDIKSPHMLFVVPIKKSEKIPAVTHVDGTGRLQTVSRELNPLYYDLINEFYKITGVPVVLNTSMNVMGEPIVNTPKQAYSMLEKTEMDYLVINNFMISKTEN